MCSLVLGSLGVLYGGMLYKSSCLRRFKGAWHFRNECSAVVRHHHEQQASWKCPQCVICALDYVHSCVNRKRTGIVLGLYWASLFTQSLDTFPSLYYLFAKAFSLQWCIYYGCFVFSCLRIIDLFVWIMDLSWLFMLIWITDPFVGVYALNGCMCY